MTDKQLSAGKAATYLGMTYKAFLIIRDDIPHRTKNGRRYYWESDLIKWKDTVRQMPTEHKAEVKKKCLINPNDCPKW